ncbi:hypothetical protein ACFMPD_11020 [Sedimentitalea sp. HM32M-2]|uniref:hypothetical protein n=1 Tax=Sedimentitalea sp. HM32M-2 TaxID=3351566 RepID=UPI0036413B3F
MLRCILTLALTCVPTLAGAADLAPIRSDFDTGYDIRAPRIGIVMARHRAAVFAEGRESEPLMNPSYGRRVPADARLRAALADSLANLLQAPQQARYRNVRMMTSASEALIVACGTVQEADGIDPAKPFVALFTNPHADAVVQSVGYAGGDWIAQACGAMGIDGP